MFINLRKIESVFENYTTALFSEESTFCLCSMNRLKNAAEPLSNYTLYLADDTDSLPDTHLTEEIHVLLCTTKNEQISLSPLKNEKHLHLLAVYNCTMDDAERMLYNFFNEQCGRGLFTETLLDILFNESGIQTMLDAVYPAFSNPIMVFDAGFHLLAANKQYVSDLPLAQKIIETGGFPEEAFLLANHFDNIHRRLLKSSSPLLVHHPELGFDQYLCPIGREKNLGHLVLSAVNRSFVPHDAELLKLLVKAINQQIKKDDFIRNNKGFSYEYFIKDLLDGKIATAPQHRDKLEYVNKEFNGLLYCIVIETARSSSTLNTAHICSEFEQELPGTTTLVYNSQIVVIIEKADQQALSLEELKKIQLICKDHSLFAGMSNAFRDILQVADYYKQALRAIELGVCKQNAPALFVYADYYLDHISNIFTQKEAPQVFCHPKLRVLLEYDAIHGTQLSETLYMYLAHERNHSAAAQAMFIHRNTMIYRMKKIDELVSIDYTNYRERQYLLLSYELSENR